MRKQEQIETARHAFESLHEAIDGMDEGSLTLPGLGDWSVREVLAHIGGWLQIDARMLRRIARGERPLAKGEERGTGDSRNHAFAADARSKPVATVLAELRLSFDAFLAVAETVPEDRFAEGRTAQRIMVESAMNRRTLEARS